MTHIFFYKMHSVLQLLQILATLILQLPPAQNSHTAIEAHPQVVLFNEVWSRSLCRAMELSVNVEQEYPGGVEHIFTPACVPLWRCSGCCGDETLQCLPTRTRNITMQLLRILPSERTGHYVELTFMEHQACECRPRRMRSKDGSSRRLVKKRRKRRRKHRRKAKDCGKCRTPRG